MTATAEHLNEFITLYEGDCLEVLPTLGEVDAVVTDPPYGVGFKYSLHDDTREGYTEWCAAWFAELKRVCDGAILISCGIANIAMWHGIDLPRWVICWHKPAAMGRCVVGFNNWEPVLYYGRGLKIGCDVFRAVIKADKSLSGHPCPKPIEWGSEQIRMTESSTILDPFAGSGTTGIAAMKEGRKCILIEKDPEYCDIIRRRVREADGVGEGSLFAFAGRETQMTMGWK